MKCCTLSVWLTSQTFPWSFVVPPNADSGRVIAALRHWKASDGRSGTRLYLWCPGCDDPHAAEIAHEPRWQWDGNLECPTITPSILVNGDQGHHAKPRCHSFVRAGQWEYLGDCTHALAGQVVPLPLLPEWLPHNGSSEAER